MVRNRKMKNFLQNESVRKAIYSMIPPLLTLVAAAGITISESTAQQIITIASILLLSGGGSALAVKNTKNNEQLSPVVIEKSSEIGEAQDFPSSYAEEEAEERNKIATIESIAEMENSKDVSLISELKSRVDAV